jgi:hypothetical protein
MHFGLYLHRKGIISSDQLVAALEAQLNCLVPIGQLALEAGILSARDLFTVLRAQNEAPHERFGEVAIELRLMTEDELMRLLMTQSHRKRPLSEILVNQRTLNPQQMKTQLKAYRRELLEPARRVRTSIVPRRISAGVKSANQEVATSA